MRQLVSVLTWGGEEVVQPHLTLRGMMEEYVIIDETHIGLKHVRVMTTKWHQQENQHGETWRLQVKRISILK